MFGTLNQLKLSEKQRFPNYMQKWMHVNRGRDDAICYFILTFQFN